MGHPSEIYLLCILKWTHKPHNTNKLSGPGWEKWWQKNGSNNWVARQCHTSKRRIQSVSSMRHLSLLQCQDGTMTHVHIWLRAHAVYHWFWCWNLNIASVAHGQLRLYVHVSNLKPHTHTHIHHSMLGVGGGGIIPLSVHRSCNSIYLYCVVYMNYESSAWTDG